jgi:hypothetical protein
MRAWYRIGSAVSGWIPGYMGRITMREDGAMLIERNGEQSQRVLSEQDCSKQPNF